MRSQICSRSRAGLADTIDQSPLLARDALFSSYDAHLEDFLFRSLLSSTDRNSRIQEVNYQQDVIKKRGLFLKREL